MSPNPSQQPNSKPSARTRAAAKAAAAKKEAAKVAPPAPSPGKSTQTVTSGAAYFTFTSNGELMITSYELAEALREAGGATFIKSKSAKKNKGIQVGVQGGRLSFARKGGAKTLDDDPPQVDSMCMCDAEC